MLPRAGFARSIVLALVLLLFLVGVQGFTRPASATDVPAWTYLRKDFSARQDPVDLIVHASLSSVRDALVAAGWHRTACGYTEYIHYNGRWRAQGLMLEKDEEGFCGWAGTRMHLRLWQLERDLILIAGHVDHTHASGHQVHDYEGVEGVVANDFRSTTFGSWQAFEDEHFLDNSVSYLHGDILVYNDGYATQVYPGGAASGAWSSRALPAYRVGLAGLSREHFLDLQ